MSADLTYQKYQSSWDRNMEEDGYDSLDELFDQKGGEIVDSYDSLDELFNQKGGELANGYDSLDELFDQKGGELVNSYDSLDELFNQKESELANGYDSLDELFGEKMLGGDDAYDNNLLEEIFNDRVKGGKDDEIFPVALTKNIDNDLFESDTIGGDKFDEASSTFVGLMGYLEGEMEKDDENKGKVPPLYLYDSYNDNIVGGFDYL